MPVVVRAIALGGSGVNLSWDHELEGLAEVHLTSGARQYATPITYYIPMTQLRSLPRIIERDLSVYNMPESQALF